MALSKKVFAPTVKTVQPAFVYDTNYLTGGVKIYFSLSSYNAINDVVRLKYTVIDPNMKSTWGANSMFKTGLEAEVPTSSLQKDDKEYYFIIPFNSLKMLTLNQYYQVQIWLKDKDGDYSAPSQATLIRPIAAPQLNINIPNESTVSIDSLSVISGSIYEPGSGNEVEALVKYQLEFFIGEKKVYDTKVLDNDMGVLFSWRSTYNFLEGTIYTLKFTGWTKNGYKIITNNTKTFTTQNYSNWDAWDEYKVVSATESFKEFGVYYVQQNGSYQRVYLTKGFEPGVTYYKSSLLKEFYTDIEKGAVAMRLSIESLKSNDKILVQRSDEFSNFTKWNTISRIDCDIDYGSLDFLIYDYQAIGDHTFYKYRFLLNSSSDNKISKLNYLIENVTNSAIYLYHKEKQLILRYNTNISNYRWVVQENIANTLGGKYPIVRRNAHTKYRQFSLNGTLYFDPSALDLNDGLDSNNKPMSNWFLREDDTLFLSVNDAFGSNNLNIFSWEDRDVHSRTAIYEKRFKDAAMEFLTDGLPKLFRSPEEGIMIITLTNVSFTPNEKLNRRVYDFSATVTEIAEATLENLIKYNLTYDPIIWRYILNADSVSINTATCVVTPFVGESELVEKDGIVYLFLIAEQEV